MANAQQINAILDKSEAEHDSSSDSEEGPTDDNKAIVAQIRQSPYIEVFHDNHLLRITMDSGATGNMIHETTA